MQKERFPAGKLVFSEGDSGSEAYRIILGSVEVSVDDGGNKVVLAHLGQGEIFGEMAMIDQQPRSASVRALEEVEVEIIKQDDFNAVLANGGEQLIPYLKTIFERLRVTNERLKSAMSELGKTDRMSYVRLAEINSDNQGPSVELIPDSPETQGQTVLEARKIHHFPFLIGRRGNVAGLGLFEENQLLIADRIPYRISRHHCLIEYENGDFYLSDHGSRLGSLVNGTGVGGPHRERRVILQKGDNHLQLGNKDSQIKFIIRV